MPPAAAKKLLKAVKGLIETAGGAEELIEALVKWVRA